MRIPALLLLLALSATANAAQIGDREIRIPQPPEHEELCAVDPNVLQLVARGTHPDSQLVTCFINREAWERREGAVMYKVEIMRPYIKRNLSDVEFTRFVEESAKVIGYINADTKHRKGAPSTSEKASIDALTKELPVLAGVSLKKGVWHPVDSAQRYEIIQMISTARMDTAVGPKEREISTVMAFVNVKGKLLTLKIVNSRDEESVSQSGVKLMRSWIGRMLEENAI